MALRWKNIFGAVLLLVITAFFLCYSLISRNAEKDPLCTSIEEDPCYVDGVYEVYNVKDYLRFNGYMNRAREEETDNEMATAVNARLMADLNMEEDERYHLKDHPYILQAILN